MEKAHLFLPFSIKMNSKFYLQIAEQRYQHFLIFWSIKLFNASSNHKILKNIYHHKMVFFSCRSLLFVFVGSSQKCSLADFRFSRRILTFLSRFFTKSLCHMADVTEPFDENPSQADIMLMLKVERMFMYAQ